MEPRPAVVGSSFVMLPAVPTLFTPFSLRDRRQVLMEHLAAKAPRRVEFARSPSPRRALMRICRAPASKVERLFNFGALVRENSLNKFGALFEAVAPMCGHMLAKGLERGMTLRFHQ